MKQKFWQAIIALGMLVGVNGPALANFVYTLDTANFAIPAPYGTATVHLIDPTHASVTFQSNTALNYFFADGGSVAVNVNAATWTLSISGNCASCTYGDGGSGNEDGFGSFNQKIDSGDGSPASRSSLITIQLTDTSGTWASDMSVLIGNASGNAVAAHIFSCPLGIGGDCSTGFATSVGGGREQKVPEPGILSLLGIGLLGLGTVALRRRRS